MTLRKLDMEGVADILDNLAAVKGPGFCSIVRAMHAMQMVSVTGQGLLLTAGAPESVAKRLRKVADGCIGLMAADLGAALGVSVDDLHEAHTWSLRLMERCGFEIEQRGA